MVSNITIIDGHPYISEGADDAELSIGEDGRLRVVNARAVAFTIDRSVDDGDTWESVLDDALSGDGANLPDYESLSYGDTLYRAVAFTAEGATAETIITVHADSTAIWLSGGHAFGVTGRLPWDPQVQVTAGRERALKQYAGRALPVALTGEALSRKVEVSGRTFDGPVDGEDTANVEHLTEIAQTETDLFLFRDPDGRRIYGQIGDIQLPRQGVAGSTGMWGYSFTLVEADKS